MRIGARIACILVYCSSISVRFDAIEMGTSLRAPVYLEQKKHTNKTHNAQSART